LWGCAPVGKKSICKPPKIKITPGEITGKKANDLYCQDVGVKRRNITGKGLQGKKLEHVLKKKGKKGFIAVLKKEKRKKKKGRL